MVEVSNYAYVIAEIGLNHGGSIEKAKQYIDAAYQCGVNCVKFQTYKTELRTTKDSSIYDILKKCELPFEAFKELKEYTENKYPSLDFMTTIFDEESLEYMESISCDFYKIASFDVTNHKLLKKISQTGKAIVISTGMADSKEIREAIDILDEGCENVAVLHCVSAYPTQEKDCNLNVIITLGLQYPNHFIGYSDHTPGIKSSIYAVAKGARMIEKHFKLDDDCVDASVSINVDSMTEMVKEFNHIGLMMGDGIPGCSEAEKGTTVHRRKS